jgi:phage terminase large subunit-like protein
VLREGSSGTQARFGVQCFTANKIEFTSTRATVIAIASDYAGAAGANPTITVFDELWAFVSERSWRLFASCPVGSPTATLIAFDTTASC